MCIMYDPLQVLNVSVLTTQRPTLTEPCRSHFLHLRMACSRPSGSLCDLHYLDMGDTRDRDFLAIRWTDGLRSSQFFP